MSETGQQSWKLTDEEIAAGRELLKRSDDALQRMHAKSLGMYTELTDPNVLRNAYDKCSRAIQFFVTNGFENNSAAIQNELELAATIRKRYLELLGQAVPPQHSSEKLSTRSKTLLLFLATILGAKIMEAMQKTEAPQTADLTQNPLYIISLGQDKVVELEKDQMDRFVSRCAPQVFEEMRIVSYKDLTSEILELARSQFLLKEEKLKEAYTIMSLVTDEAQLEDLLIPLSDAHEYEVLNSTPVFAIRPSSGTSCEPEFSLGRMWTVQMPEALPSRMTHNFGQNLEQPLSGEISIACSTHLLMEASIGTFTLVCGSSNVDNPTEILGNFTGLELPNDPVLYAH